MMISDDLSMLFNMTKKEVLLLPGCPKFTIYHTSLGTVSIIFDTRAAALPEVVSLDVRSDHDLIPTLKYLEHQNSHALSDLNDTRNHNTRDCLMCCARINPAATEDTVRWQG